jgi:hypothetical protein
LGFSVSLCLCDSVVNKGKLGHDPRFRIGVIGLPVLGFQPGSDFPIPAFTPSRLLSLGPLIHHKFDVMADT